MSVLCAMWSEEIYLGRKSKTIVSVNCVAFDFYSVWIKVIFYQANASQRDCLFKPIDVRITRNVHVHSGAVITRSTVSQMFTKDTS